jgi:hypothetical protein
MVLQSNLFRNDPKLEAAAVSDPAHIVPGARGGHVGKIQLALILVDRAALAADAIYGPLTAAAVASFKQKRRILNYQGKVDNIVGKKTIDRLDKEMLIVERLNTGRTPHCTFPPDTQPSTRASFAVGGGSDAVTGFTLLAEKDASLPTAKSWVASTISKIDMVQLKLSSLTVASPADIAFFASIETHFKVNIPGVSKSVASARLARIREVYVKIQRVLDAIGPGSTRVVGNPGIRAKATAPLNGFNVPGQFVTIGADFHRSNANMRAAVLIHEGGHFADPFCSHAASEQPAPDGSPIDDEFAAVVNPRRLNYAQLDFDLHIQNAYSFAQCAMHNGLGFDKRPP